MCSKTLLVFTRFLLSLFFEGRTVHILCITTLQPFFHDRLLLWAPMNQIPFQYSDRCMIFHINSGLVLWLAGQQKASLLRIYLLLFRSQSLCNKKPSLTLCQSNMEENKLWPIAPAEHPEDSVNLLFIWAKHIGSGFPHLSWATLADVTWISDKLSSSPYKIWEE